jgi:hypothetical protein
LPQRRKDQSHDKGKRDDGGERREFHMVSSVRVWMTDTLVRAAPCWQAR